MKCKIGIVGGSGYIGFSLAKILKNKYEVKLLDIKNPPMDIKGNIEYNYCDITKPEEIRSNFKDINLVIHTAIVQIPLINEKKKLGYQVNVLGTQNICDEVEKNHNIRGMILTGTWHTIGEKELRGIIDEEFGFRPDKVEDRARLYALSKMAQESITRFHDEMSDKVFGIIRMGTVIGEGMPEKTAANIFIEQGLKGGPITPYRHSMYRPMLYVDIRDICIAFEKYIEKINSNEIEKNKSSLANIVNVYYPVPITILELAQYIGDSIIDITNGSIKPKIKIQDMGIPPQFTENDRFNIKVNIDKTRNFLHLNILKNPLESIYEIIKLKLK